METELEIIDSLNALNYQGKCLKNDELCRALEGGTRSEEFREVVAWLAEELHILRKTDESVSKDCTDPSEFAMELSAMLKELGCPYSRFVTGPLSERFETKEDRMQLIDFLTTELMAIKMVLRLKPAEQVYIIPKSETNTAKALESLTKDLGLGKPPENVTPKAFFDKLNFKLEERLRSVKKGVVSEPLLKTNKPLTDAQWQMLQEIHEDLDKEYNLRRQVLLTRLEVTVQSFQWSDKMKTRENEIVERFQKKLKEMEALKYGGENTNIVALLAAREDLAVIEKTSSANVRKNTHSKIQKHVIGSVPDRGGRAHEHAPPPPEMPSWQQQRASGPAGGGGGRGGGGNFRGGRGGGDAGGGGGGGGHWQQNSQPQRQPQQQHYQSQQQQPQQNYEQQQREQAWIQGSGRVQGTGWSNRGQDYQSGNNYQASGYNQGGGGGSYNQNSGGGHYQNSDRDNRGGGGGSHYQNNDRDNRGGGGGGYRGRSNYNRGGGGGGGHRR